MHFGRYALPVYVKRGREEPNDQIKNSTESWRNEKSNEETYRTYLLHFFESN